MLSFNIKDSILYFEGDLLLFQINDVSQEFPFHLPFKAIHLKMITKIDTVGLAFLLEIYRQQQKHHHDIAFLNAPDKLSKIMLMYDLVIKDNYLQKRTFT